MDASSLSLDATVRKAERLKQVLSRCKGSLNGFQSDVPRSVLPSPENELVRTLTDDHRESRNTFEHCSKFNVDINCFVCLNKIFAPTEWSYVALSDLSGAQNFHRHTTLCRQSIELSRSMSKSWRAKFLVKMWVRLGKQHASRLLKRPHQINRQTILSQVSVGNSCACEAMYSHAHNNRCRRALESACLIKWVEKIKW